ncbi:MBL fold metallo-hydrolase [Halosegnis sp.]|uniref:MBL fold metallo-hydrolase n=1 Tax=Halosegnis sp. TaxID=2864959 RepID=UPI0035D40188
MTHLSRRRRNDATRLRSGVWQLDCGGVNAYLAEDPADSGTITLVDAGTPWSVDRLRDGVAAAGFEPAAVERVLMTHYDLDHVGGLAGIAVDGPHYIGASDQGFLIGDEKPPAGNLKGALQRLVGPLVDRPDAEVVGLGDGDKVGSFRVYRTPGHTPGHVAYVSKRLSVAFVGDLVVESGGQLRPSPWYLSYDADRVVDSLSAFADKVAPVEAVGMGHGTPFVRDGAVRLAEAAAAAQS